MKASELMIGDWVSYRNTHKRVVYINDRPLRELHNNEVGFTSRDNEWIAAHNAQPIPITEEILKKNGFIVNDEYATIYDDNDECLFSISIRKTGMWLPISFYGRGLRLIYVHELQHALRLCGLNEIAENFKVK